MRDLGRAPNIIAYSALVSARGKGHKGNRDPVASRGARDQGLTPNVLAYSALVCAREKGQKGSEDPEALPEDA